MTPRGGKNSSGTALGSRGAGSKAGSEKQLWPFSHINPWELDNLKERKLLDLPQ